MADQAQLELIISSQADRVLAGLASFERALKTAEQAHVSAGAAAQLHTQHLEGLTQRVEGTARALASLWVIWEAGKNIVNTVASLESFNINLLHTTELLGGNAQAASTWSAIAGVMGIDVSAIEKAFAKLSTDLNSTGNPALKQMGIAAEDANGKLRPLNDIVNQAADYFHAHAGAVNNAALANALFGRAGYELLPILQQGSAGLAQFTEVARKYGLILDAEAIQRNAAFTFQLKEAEMAVRGLGVSIGNAVLPGIAAMGQALSRVISDNLPAFIAGIQRAVSYIIGMIEAFTGVSLAVDQGAVALSDFSGVAGDTGSAMDKTAGSSKWLAEQQRAITDAARDATAALDDQIRALNAEMAATAFADRQTALGEQVASKEKDITKLRQRQYQEFWLGNFQTAQQTGDQIVAAQQQEEDLKLQITRSTQDERTKLTIAGLETQKRSINDAAQSQIQALQAAAAAGSAAIGGMASGFAPTIGAGAIAAGDKFKFAMDKAAEQTGLSMGIKLQDALFGPQVWVDPDKKIAGHFERQGATSFTQIGTAIGDAIVGGMTTAVGKGFAAWWNNTFLPGIKRGLTPGIVGGSGGGFDPSLFAHSGHGNLSFGGGGIVPGPRGASVFPVEVHGGEEIRTPEQQAAGMAETNSLLRQLIQLIAGGQSSGGGSSASTDSMMYEIMERARRQRSMGIVGSYGR